MTVVYFYVAYAADLLFGGAFFLALQKSYAKKKNEAKGLLRSIDLWTAVHQS